MRKLVKGNYYQNIARTFISLNVDVPCFIYEWELFVSSGMKDEYSCIYFKEKSWKMNQPLPPTIGENISPKVLLLNQKTFLGVSLYTEAYEIEGYLENQQSQASAFL